MQAQGLLRRLAPVLNWVALAALLGALAGLSAALKLASDNSYFQESMRNLAGRELEIGAFRGAQSGLLIAAGALLVFFLAWPVCRLILRSSRKATLGAALAVPVLAILAIVAFKINLDVFPSLLSVPSLLGNAGLLAASFLLWWFLVKWLAHLQDRLGGIAGSLSATAALGVLLVLVVGAPMGLAQLWKVEVDSRKPNVLIVLIDALRADRLGSYGYQRDTSPNIDKVAKEGWRFTSAISQAPWTQPSVASLITGLYVRQTSISGGSWEDQEREGAVLVDTLSAGHWTLAEQLASIGYETAAFGKNHHLLPELGFAQGYETYDWLQPFRVGDLPKIFRRFRPEFAGDLVARRIDDHFIDWVDANEDRRFFAYLHHINVHWPYRSPAPFSGMYTKTPSPENFNSTKFMPNTVKRLKEVPGATLDPATLRAMSDAYDEGIRYVDDSLGKMFDALARRGLYDNTLIIIVADHGEEFLEHGLLGHGESLYDELIRVPLIVKFPCPGPYCSPRTVTSQVESVDIFPTVMGVIGKEPPADLVGRNLAAVTADSEVAYSELNSSIALRTPDWKLIYDEKGDSTRLYNLKEDPREANDLANSEPALRKVLLARVLDFGATHQKGASAHSDTVEADEAMLENLKALGYVK